MKLTDIVNQLRTVLPKYDSGFTTNVAFSSVVSSSDVLTITTSAAHGLLVGDAVTLSGFAFNNSISSVSQDGTSFTFVTTESHDLTEGWQDEISLSGFTDANWNGSFTLASVPNRTSFVVSSSETIPVLNGNEVLLETRSGGANGQFSVATTPDTTHFTVEGDLADGTYTEGYISALPQIHGVVDIDRALEQYTEQSLTDDMIFVAMSDAEVSKDRSQLSDAVSAPVTGVDLRLRVLDSFKVYVIINTSNSPSGVAAVDRARHELLLPLMKSLYGAKFTTGLSGSGDFMTVLTGHGMALYDLARYVHVYDFEISMDLTGDDAVEPELTRAFRDINWTNEAYYDNMTFGLNLDDEPDLPDVP